jgi:peptide/nickel transport system permease protein
MKRAAAAAGLAVVLAAAVLAPWLAPNDPARTFRTSLFAPPMRPHLWDDEGRWRGPFVYPLRLVSRIEQRYQEDRTSPLPLVLFSGGRLVAPADDSRGPWLPLGADSEGRDVFSRLVFGARASMGVALLATLAAVACGVLVGGAAGYFGGAVDAAAMGTAQFVLVLPAVYVVLALRTALPLILEPWAVFVLMSAILAFVGWPWVARAVRATVAVERTREYAMAAVSLGAGHRRVLFGHLLPACRGIVGVQVILLLPSFIIAEATLSYVGLGFPETVPSWGSMLHQASNINAIADFPWTLAPALAIFAVTLAANLLVEDASAPPAR